MYKENDIVEVQIEEDPKKWFVAKVEGSLYKWPKGEAMYCWSYDKPLPQVIVTLFDGRQQRYCGEEKVAKFIKFTEKKWADCQPIKLIDELKRIKVTIYYDGEYKSSLLDCLTEIEQKILEPLNNEIVYRVNEDHIELGEFDTHRFHIQSVKMGGAMRNSGTRAFTIQINTGVDAVNRLRIETSEVLTHE